MQPESTTNTAPVSTPPQATPPTQVPAAPQSTDAIVSGIFWNKSQWNPRKSLPVVLELRNGTLTMYDSQDSKVFSVPVSTVQATFKTYGGMYLTVNGTRFFLSFGRQSTSRHSKIQQSRLRTSDNPMSLAIKTKVNSSGQASPNGSGAGVLYTSGVHGITWVGDVNTLANKWRAALQQNGAQVSGEPQGTLIVIVTLVVTAIALTLIAVFGPDR